MVSIDKFKKSFLTIFFFVKIFQKALQCDPTLQQNISNLLYLNETELMERMVSNYDFVYSAVLNRIRLAEKNVLNTYSNLLEKNLNFWKEALTIVEIAFAQELDPKNRLRLLLTAAAVTEGMVWDEKVRINYPEITSDVNVTDSSIILEINFYDLIVKLNSLLDFVAIEKGKENNFYWAIFYPVVSF